jgi:hypothetical protein
VTHVYFYIVAVSLGDANSAIAKIRNYVQDRYVHCDLASLWCGAFASRQGELDCSEKYVNQINEHCPMCVKVTDCGSDLTMLGGRILNCCA